MPEASPGKWSWLRAAGVVMMQATQIRDGPHATGGRRLDDAWLRRVVGQRHVRARFVVIDQILPNDPQEVALVEGEHVIEAFPP